MTNRQLHPGFVMEAKIDAEISSGVRHAVDQGLDALPEEPIPIAETEQRNAEQLFDELGSEPGIVVDLTTADTAPDDRAQADERLAHAPMVDRARARHYEVTRVIRPVPPTQRQLPALVVNVHHGGHSCAGDSSRTKVVPPQRTGAPTARLSTCRPYRPQSRDATWLAVSACTAILGIVLGTQLAPVPRAPDRSSATAERPRANVAVPANWSTERKRGHARPSPIGPSRQFVGPSVDE